MLSSPPGQWTGQGASRLLRHASPLPFLRWVKVFLLECGLYFTTCLAHRYSDVFRNSLFHHPSFLRDVIGSDQHIGMLSAPCFVSGVPLRACKHASCYYVHSPVADKGMLEAIFFSKAAPPKMLKVIQIPMKCWKNLPSSTSVRVRAHLLLRARTRSSSVAPPIAKIPKGNLEAMPRVTQK